MSLEYNNKIYIIQITNQFIESIKKIITEHRFSFLGIMQQSAELNLVKSDYCVICNDIG